MKRFAAILIALIMVLPSIASPASAAEGQVNVFFNGNPLAFGINKNGSVFVPFRAIFEELGLSVKFDAAKKQVIGEKENLKVELAVGKKTATVNGKSQNLVSAPFVQSGTTYIPLRFVTASTGNNVTWTQEINLAHVITPEFKGLTYWVDNEYSLTFDKSGNVTYMQLPGEEDLVYFKDLSDPSKTQDENAGEGSGLPQGATLQPDDGPSWGEEHYLPPGFDDVIAVEEEEPGYKGHPDWEDHLYQEAEYYGDPLPPLMSEGWISEYMLDEIEGIEFAGSPLTGEPVLMNGRGDILLALDIPDEYYKVTDGDFIINDDIKVKKFSGQIYFNISDLKDAGLIK